MQFMSQNCFEEILGAMSYTDKSAPELLDKFWEVRDLISAWNASMEVEFLPSWINAIDESMSKWLNEYTCLGFMYIPRKPWKLGNEWHDDRIPSTTPGAEPPRDTRDSGSARSHSTHLETSSSDRPKWSPTRSSTRYQDQISVTCTRWTLRMPSFTHATHAQPSLSNFTRRDSNFGERTRSRGTTLGERNFPTAPQNKKTKLTHCSIYVPMRTISTSHAK